jgi:hypothetical protein
MLDGKIMTKKKNKKSKASTRQNHENNQVDHQKMNSNVGAAIAGGENLIYISPSRVCSIVFADTCF